LTLAEDHFYEIIKTQMQKIDELHERVLTLSIQVQTLSLEIHNEQLKRENELNNNSNGEMVDMDTLQPLLRGGEKLD
jgi:hypothetical protein